MLENKIPIFFEVYENTCMPELKDLLDTLDCELIPDWSTKFIRGSDSTIVYRILLPNENKARTYVKLMSQDYVYGIWVFKNKDLVHFNPEL